MGEGDVYMRLAGKVNFPKSRYIRQVFRKLVTPEEGELLLALPASPAELAERFQTDEAMVNQKLDEFVGKGVALPLEKGGVLRHFCVAHIIQFHDASIRSKMRLSSCGSSFARPSGLKCCGKGKSHVRHRAG